MSVLDLRRAPLYSQKRELACSLSLSPSRGHISYLAFQRICMHMHLGIYTFSLRSFEYIKMRERKEIYSARGELALLSCYRYCICCVIYSLAFLFLSWRQLIFFCSLRQSYQFGIVCEGNGFSGTVNELPWKSYSRI